VVSYSGELAVHSCALLCLQGQIRIARLAFLGQISYIWPRFKLVVLKKFIWPFGLIPSCLALKNSFDLLALLWPFYAGNFSSEGKYDYYIFSATYFQNIFDKCYIRPTRRLRSNVSNI